MAKGVARLGALARLAEQDNTKLSIGFVIDLLVSLWSANAGIKAIFDALNIAYDEEEKRSLIKLNTQALLFTLAAIVFLLIAIAATAVLPVVLKFVGLGSVTEWLLTILRWPLLLAILLFGLGRFTATGPVAKGIVALDRLRQRGRRPGLVDLLECCSPVRRQF